MVRTKDEVELGAVLAEDAVERRRWRWVLVEGEVSSTRKISLDVDPAPAEDAVELGRWHRQRREVELGATPDGGHCGAKEVVRAKNVDELGWRQFVGH
uniref:Uncharacterized protein n=1 Tax=Oryza nivara TaxID=4536 RepID=A0A0E0IQA5_ORYNI